MEWWLPGAGGLMEGKMGSYLMVAELGFCKMFEGWLQTV